MKKINWNAVLGWAWHIALIGGSVATQIYAPGLAPIIMPALQAAGQLSPPPAGLQLSVMSPPAPPKLA